MEGTVEGAVAMRSESTSWRHAVLALVVLLALGAWLAPSSASAAGRVALVVGNGAYGAIGTLPNPGNDAADVAAALGRLGFEVTTVRDADRAGLTAALRAFARQSAGADVSLVFYAGHGLEVDGVNYLVPVDARLERDTDVRFETVALYDVLASTVGASLRVVIRDACRNNPLSRSMQRTGAARSVSRGSFGELNEALLGDETLVAYAAAAGTTAADGTGRNSPYTSALLAYLERPLEIGILFREVRARVLESTGGEQRPHEYASLLGEHYLAGAAGPGTVTAAVAVSGEARAQQETVFWQSISGSRNAADFEAYLEQFPNGVFARLARNRMAALGAAAGDPPAVARPRPGSGTRPAADSPVTPTRGREFRDCDDCPEMVVIPAGSYRMGCVSGSDSCWDDARPVRDVEVASFALAKYEVTRGQFAAFAAATGHQARGCRLTEWDGDSGIWDWRYDEQAFWREPGFYQRDNEPVVCVSWEDAQAYVRWLSTETGEEYRLPSEAEWEYAVRAGTTTSFHWGASDDEHCPHANAADRSAERTFTPQEDHWWFSDCADGAVHTALVGSFAANGFGLHDMAGNVREWIEDCWHDNYAGAPRDGSAWTSGGDCGRRVLRGGSWRNFPAYLRSANRVRNAAGARNVNLGFVFRGRLINPCVFASLPLGGSGGRSPPAIGLTDGGPPFLRRSRDARFVRDSGVS